MPDVLLRAATADDASGVADVILASRAAFLPYAPPAHSEDEVRAWVSGSLIPSGGVTVACAGPDVVGVVAVAIREQAGWIEQLYVSPDWGGRGIGSRLLARALGQLPRPVRLFTFQENVPSRSFYERRGFRALAFSDGAANEERCPDVLYELARGDDPG